MNRSISYWKAFTRLTLRIVIPLAIVALAAGRTFAQLPEEHQGEIIPAMSRNV